MITRLLFFLNTYYDDQFIFCSSLISILKYRSYCKISNDSFTIVCTCFLIYSLNLNFWSSYFCVLVFLIYSLNLTFSIIRFVCIFQIHSSNLTFWSSEYHFLFDKTENHWEQQGKRSCLLWPNIIYVRFDSLKFF